MSFTPPQGAGGGGGDVPAMIEVSTVTLGSAATEIEITGLDLNTDSLYFFVVEATSGSGTGQDLTIEYNGSTAFNDSEYQRWNGAGDSFGTEAGRVSSAFSNSDGAIIWGYIFRTGGEVIVTAYSRQTNNFVYESIHATTTGPSNLTAFKVVTSVTDALAADSRLSIYKVIS